MSKDKIPPTVLSATAIACVVLGIVLILVWWPYVIAFTKGCIGMILAVVGLFILYLIRKH